MSKRRRDVPYRDVIIILRGVPGSGKTTTCRELTKMFFSHYEQYVQCISRDCSRYEYCAKRSIDYQASFHDPAINTIVRDEFYQHLFDCLDDYRKTADSTITIIDATNTKIADLKMIFWIIKRTSNVYKEADVYLYTKRHEHGSIHGVPESVMQRFREELKESDEWLKKNNPLKSNFIVK